MRSESDIVIRCDLCGARTLAEVPAASTGRMQTQFQFIHFVEIAKKTKTLVWSCRNNKNDEQLGEVRWYTPWRKYCYFPTVVAAYSAGCLSDIHSFIEALQKERITP